MDSNRNRWLLLGAAATLASAVTFWLGGGLTPVWWLAWLAPLPVLLLAPRVRASTAALAAFVAVFVAAFSQWHYAHDLVRLPMFVLLLSAIAPAAIFTLCVLLFRWLGLRGRPVAAMFSLPLSWTAVSFANAAFSPHGTWATSPTRSWTHCR